MGRGPEPTEQQVGAILATGDGLDMAFQPVYDLRRGSVAGFEALSRFGPDAPTPDRWFAVAAQIGLGPELEALALVKAFAARERFPPDTFLSVNVSPSALLDPLVQRTLGAQERLGGVVLEITEGEAVADYAVLADVLDPLRENGMLVAIDDAGAGFASLRHITTLCPHFVKIDQGLVAGIDADPARAAAVETLGALASRIDAWVIAEGVETQAELRCLDQLLVPLAQGFALGRPAAHPHADPLELEGDRASRRYDDPTLAGVLALVESVPSGRPDDIRAELTRRFVLDHAGEEVIVLLDDHDRPNALLDRETFLRGRRPDRSPMVIGATDALPDVARRAMSRPAERRFDPVVCADEQGRLIGVVRMERLVEALAAEAA